MNSIVSYQIVENTQHMFGQLDEILLEYYRSRWPTLVEDFTPVTWRDPLPHHSPLQMIVDSYLVVKAHYPNKQDLDILSAIVLFYYSTVVLEYYVLKESSHYTIFLQQKYISEDGSIIVTQNNKIFRVLDTSVTNGLLELQQVVFTTTTSTGNSCLQFQLMQKTHRKEMLMLLSRQLQGKEDGSFDITILPQRFFLDPTDPYKCILTDQGDSKTQATVDGFFRRFQNKEVNSLLFEISCHEEDWARQVRRQYHGMDRV